MATSKSDPQTIALRNTLRQTFRERRKALSLTDHNEAAKQLVSHSQTLGLFEHAQKIALYMTNDGELNTKPLITYLWGLGKEVYLPVLHPFADGHLLFLRYEENTAMRANHFGILEPKLDCTKICPVNQLDILFTPLVAFDETGNRLGMGGGFYDRTLTQTTRDNVLKPQVIGLALEIQKTLTLPMQAWDIPLLYILTPTTLYTCKS
jgi:5-formyltetrahydrofolate cyclo-ligase